MRPLVLALLSSILAAEDIGPTAIRDVYAPTVDVVESVSRMAGDQRACSLFRARGLDVLSVTWEDTGRSKGSCWGPNISDLTIQVLGQQPPLPPGCVPDQGRSGWCMPVVRHPNFADVSCDVPIERLKVLVGNERGGALRAIDLGSYLRSFASYQSSPTGRLTGSLIGDRDHAVLVSAQACYLPIPHGGEATFAPVLFNYQSAPGAPAVLTLVVTPEGTSAQAITNSSAASAGVWHGQRLYHNRAGQRAPLSAKRLSDVGASTGTGQTVAADSAAAAGMSMVMVIQIPLVHPEYRSGNDDCALACAPAAAGCAKDAKESSRSESAVVRSGPVEGPWIGLDGCTIERDWRFPIRATVQFYQATDSGEIVPADVDRLAKAIDRIYLSADAVGSLVTDGATGRPTEHVAAPAWPQPFYRGVCEDYTSRTGEPWQAALARVHARLGADWQPADARELKNALALARP